MCVCVAVDPFKAVLDGGVRDPLAVPGSLAQGVDRSDPLTAALSSRAGRSFRPQDVDNLLSILGNGALAADLRK